MNFRKSFQIKYFVCIFFRILYFTLENLMVCTINMLKGGKMITLPPKENVRVGEIPPLALTQLRY